MFVCLMMPKKLKPHSLFWHYTRPKSGSDIIQPDALTIVIVSFHDTFASSLLYCIYVKVACYSYFILFLYISVHSEASSNRRHSITSSDYRHDGLFNQVAEDFPVSVCLAENRNVKEYQPFSEFGQVMKRKDMNGRCIDHVTLDSQSFYRCISKEVFGSENFHSYLRNKVSTAMEECLTVTQPKQSGKSSTKYSFLFGYHNRGFLPLTAEDQKTPDIFSSKEATDDEIMVSSYLFKTPIYVLCCYSDGSSQWIEYNHIGIQPDVENYYRGRCRLDDKARGHYITLLRSSCGHYNRIVPRTKVCNCLMKPVDTNVQEQDDSLLKMNKNGRH